MSASTLYIPSCPELEDEDGGALRTCHEQKPSISKDPQGHPASSLRRQCAAAGLPSEDTQSGTWVRSSWRGLVVPDTLTLPGLSIPREGGLTLSSPRRTSEAQAPAMTETKLQVEGCGEGNPHYTASAAPLPSLALSAPHSPLIPSPGMLSQAGPTPASRASSHRGAVNWVLMRN